MDEKGVVEASETRLTREQKTGLALLLVFAVISVALGVLQIRNRLYAPFALSSTIPGSIKDEVNTVEALRYRDTDHDTLNDFDELYVHNTSPYLADTDSDGITDQIEIQKGSNPLCATGKSCDNPIISGQGVVAGTETTSTAPSAAEALAGFTDLTTMLEDPKQIRALLIQNGIKKEIVDKISDKDLLLMMSQALQTASSTKR